jgi:hypothetical protein
VGDQRDTLDEARTDVRLSVIQGIASSKLRAVLELLFLAFCLKGRVGRLPGTILLREMLVLALLILVVVSRLGDRGHGGKRVAAVVGRHELEWVGVGSR